MEEKIRELTRRHVNRGQGKLASLLGIPVEAYGEGCYIYDSDHKRYLNCGGYGVFLLGHNHPDVVQAVEAQLKRLPLSSRFMLNPLLAEAAEATASITPQGLDYSYFTSSGCEAVETALKLACVNGKYKFIAMDGSYHGKTTGALSVTSGYRSPFQPLLRADVQFVPFGDLNAVNKALAHTRCHGCVIVEPVQAEGGVHIAPKGFLREVQQLCRQHKAFFILDEIQTGMGRLGTWFGADIEQVVPDVILVGKSLGGGVIPVSAAVASADAFEPFNANPFLHTSTFSGYPLAMAAVTATIDVIQRENLVARAHELGVRILTQLRALREAYPHLVREVRGMGLLIGLEFGSVAAAGEFLMELLRRRVIISTALNAKQVMRLTPPATLSDSDVNWLLEAVGESLHVISKNASIDL